jgi:hypothetical protein
MTFISLLSYRYISFNASVNIINEHKKVQFQNMRYVIGIRFPNNNMIAEL